MREEKLFQAFKMFDVDGSGKISKEELKQVLGCKNIMSKIENEMDKNNNAKWESFIKDADADGDGEVNIIQIFFQIDYQEFIEMMEKIKV